jgi:hypothetical protein
LVEDASSALLSLAAALAPFLVPVVFVALLVAVVMLWQRRRARATGPRLTGAR